SAQRRGAWLTAISPCNPTGGAVPARPCACHSTALPATENAAVPESSVPQENGRIRAAGGKLLAVGGEGQAMDATHLARKLCALLADGDIPESNAGVGAGDGEQRAVRGKRDGRCFSTRHRKAAPLLAGCRLPEANRAIFARGDQRLA